MLQIIFRFRTQDLAASLKSVWERDEVKFLCCLKIAFMLFSGKSVKWHFWRGERERVYWHKH